MDTEKDFLKKDLGKAETKEEIEKLIDDAETMGHEDIAEMAKEKLAAVLAKAEAVETTSPAQVSQVESMGGSVDEVAKRTEGVDEEIEAVKAETEQKIAGVQGESFSEVNQTSEEAPVKTSDEGVEIKESSAEVNLSKLREKVSDEEKKEGRTFVVDGKFVDLDEIVSNPELVQKIDWNGHSGLKASAQLLEKKLISPKDLIKGLSSLSNIGSLKDVPVETLDALEKQQPYEFRKAMEDLAKKGLGVDSRQKVFIATSISRLPPDTYDSVVLQNNLNSSLQKTRDGILADWEDEDEITTSGNLEIYPRFAPALFEGGLVSPEEIKKWLKKDMAGKMSKEFFTIGVKCILKLEHEGKISKEEADDFIKNNPNFEKYMK